MRKTHFNILVAVCVFMMTLTGPATGRTIYVDPNGSADFTTIQAAIDNANNGDEIEVAPGTYYEAINFDGKAVRLYSLAGPEVTTIDPNVLSSSVVTCSSGEDANTILEGFTITGGNASQGGGMHNSGSSPTVTNCIFSGNYAAGSGGGMFNYQSSPTVTGCKYILNQTDFHGGGIYNQLCSPRVINCVFSQNMAAVHGGGMMNNDYSNPTVVNCSFIQNTANGDGGGIANSWFSSSTVTNCTFTNNTAAGGGGIYIYAGSLTATNCIFWGNTTEILNDSSTSTVTYSDVQGGTVYPGTGNINADPRFADAAGGDLRLSSSASPCVDTGTNGAPGLPATDLAGNPRVVDGDRNGTATVDMGAYELQALPIHNITQARWYDSIQVSIDDANDEDQIEVGPGIYYEAINFNDKAVRLYSSGGPEVTTIDGDGAYHVVQCVSGEDANTILEGFTITGGNANGTYPNDRGGGMYNDHSSPTVTNCTFSGNTADYDGGGMYNSGGSPTVTNCTFSSNSAQNSGGGMSNYQSSSPTVTNCNFSGNSSDRFGGGMYNYQSSPTVTNCNFSGNTAGYLGSGGGMFNNGSSPTVTNCTFSGNSAIGAGGGMYNYQSSSPTVTNCTFIYNTTDYDGGGMYNYQSSSPTVTNCTFIYNTTDYDGGGMYNTYSSSPTVTNCIFWNDTPNEIYNNSSSPTVTYSDVEGGWTGTGNIDADPCFVDANNPDPNLWNLRLAPGSPCIDAGDNTGVPASVLKDLAGKLRFADDPCTPDTGDAGTTGRAVVDMGAYEFQCCGTISQNLLANPGFETGDATGWMANWGLAADTNQVHEGNYSGLASGRTASWDGAWQSVLGLMDDGKTYRISGWVRLQNADSNYVQLTVKKTDLGGTNFYFIDNATGFDDQWVHLDGTLALDVIGQPTELYVYFEGPAPDVNFYVDDAAVTEVMGDMNHDGGVDFIDFSLFASYYGFDCSTQDCGRANLNDSDNTINERDLAILAGNWLAGTEP